jgi:DNA-binding Lrp family transcriptional regulator
MFINKDITETDKIILNEIGKNADTPISDLLLHTKYKRKSSVYNRIRNLREEKYLFGPYFDINFNAIGTNKLFSIFVFAQYNLNYKDVVLEAMRIINCWTMLYPVRTAEFYLGVYRCNNWNFIANLFNLMKQWGWLKDYTVHKSEFRWILQNPNFSGEFMPPRNYKIPKGELPQYSYEDLELDFEFAKTDLVVLKYLSRKTCHLTEIRDLEYQNYGLQLKYHDLKRSYQRLKQSRILIEKNFLIFPFPSDMCSLFFLFSKGKRVESNLEIITNFGRDLRVTKGIIPTSSEVISYFAAHPLLEYKILGILEDKVKYANIYGIKTYPSSELLVQSFNDDYFDIENQRWIFPYSQLKEKIQILREENEE